MTVVRARVGVVFAALGAAFLGGCAAQQTARIVGFDDYYQRADYSKASEFALSAAASRTNSSQSLLWTLQAASAMRGGGDFMRSNEYFDRAERLMKRQDGESRAEARGGGGVRLPFD